VRHHDNTAAGSALPADGTTIDHQAVAADLVRSHLDVDLSELDDRVITRSLHHRHSSWRRGTRLHWSATCSRMSGRSPVASRTVQFSTADTELLDTVCTACRPRRTRELADVVGAASIIELVDRYVRPGDQYHPDRGAPTGHTTDQDAHESRQAAAAARRHALRLTQLHPEAGPILTAVDTRRPLPHSLQLHQQLVAAAWKATDTPESGRLRALGAAQIVDRLTDAPTGRARRQRWCADLADAAWPQVTATQLRHLGDHPGSSSTGGPYQQLHDQWHQQVVTTALTWFDGLERHRRDTPAGKELLVISAADLNDPDTAERWQTPTGLAVAVDHRDGLRLYALSAAAAGLYARLLPPDTVAEVGDDRDDHRDLGRLALQLASDGELDDAVAVARAAWSGPA
jgi:hypothetical protein